MCLAVPARIESIRGLTALCRMGGAAGVTRRVDLALVPEAGPGDWLIVHVGFALRRIDEAEARETLGLLERLAGLPEGALSGSDAGEAPAGGWP